MMTLPDVDNRVQLVEGVMPREVLDHGTDAPLLIEGILDMPSAKMLDIRVGDIYTITPHWEDILAEVQVLVTGVYERVDPESDHWRIQNEAFGSRTNALQFARFVVPEPTILEGLGSYLPTWEQTTRGGWMSTQKKLRQLKQRISATLSTPRNES